ncbi:hypothetical protein B0H67DRAFT_457748, partial [Lasiosphaeris hirsuta]
KTYNTRNLLVTTDLTTSLALTNGLCMGGRTGSRAFLWIWPYVADIRRILSLEGRCRETGSPFAPRPEIKTQL